MRNLYYSIPTIYIFNDINPSIPKFLLKLNSMIIPLIFFVSKLPIIISKTFISIRLFYVPVCHLIKKSMRKKRNEMKTMERNQFIYDAIGNVL